MADRDRLHESWARTRTHLGRAAVLLPVSPVESADGGCVRRYREWIEHNELELALDELEGLGDRSNVPGEFWSHLLDAAKEMGLRDHVLRLGRRSSEGAG